MQRYTVVFKLNQFAESSAEAGELAYQNLRYMFDEYGSFDIEVVDSEGNVEHHVITTGPNLVHNGT